MDEWVEKIRLLLENEAKRSSMRKQELLKAEKKSIDRMAEILLDMYYGIIVWKMKYLSQPFIR